MSEEKETNTCCPALGVIEETINGIIGVEKTEKETLKAIRDLGLIKKCEFGCNDCDGGETILDMLIHIEYYSKPGEFIYDELDRLTICSKNPFSQTLWTHHHNLYEYINCTMKKDSVIQAIKERKIKWRNDDV